MTLPLAETTEADANAISRLMAWWFGNLAQLLSSLASRFRNRQLVLLKTPNAIEAFYHHSRSCRRLGAVASDDGDAAWRNLAKTLRASGAARAPIVLRLSSGVALESTITLPSAARDVLEPVVANQMQRIAPWSRDQTLFGYEVAGRDAGAEQLIVKVVATSRDIVEQAKSELARLGCAPQVVDQAADGAANSGIMLLDSRNGRLQAVAKRIERGFFGLAAIAMIIAGVGTAQLLWQQRVLQQLEGNIDVAKSQIARIDRLRAARADLMQQQLRLSARKTREPAMVMVLENLSQIIPDQAWLTSLEVAHEKVTLRGRAANAAGIIADLEASRFFRNVAFSAPTTRDEDGGAGALKENFAITAIAVTATAGTGTGGNGTGATLNAQEE